MTQPEQNDLERMAEEGQAPFLVELTQYLRENKKWWLTPIIIALLLLGVLVWLGGTSLAPYIYPLF